MIIITEQVCSLEHAKKLKELGIKQESLFYWTICGPIYRSEMPFLLDNNYSAFTVAELCELLPPIFEKQDKDVCGPFNLEIRKYNHIFTVNYYDPDDQWWKECETEDVKLADALAKMLIYLLENNLINVSRGT